jgi:uncharacterized DUF497 family protein
MSKTEFEWDSKKEAANITKHGVSFFDAQQAFLDQNRIIAQDLEHSKGEIRYYCFGMVEGMVMTVRFTYPEFAKCSFDFRRNPGFKSLAKIAPTCQVWHDFRKWFKARISLKI